MSNKTKLLAMVATTGAVALGGLALGSGAAQAMPSDAPCSSSDVTVSITPDPSNAAGHEAFVVTYTATGPGTNCKLEGTPTGVHFSTDGTPLAVTVTPDTTQTAAPVNLREGHPATSRIIQQSAAAPDPTPTTASLYLPTALTGQSTFVEVPWPAGGTLKGSTVEVTPVSGV
jgi:hypothetical protein